MTLDTANIIQLLFVFQTAFFGVLAMPRARLRAFALLLFAFALHMALNLLAETGNLGAFPNITSAFGFAYGPLVYLYVRDITHETPLLGRRDLVHGIPFLAAMPFSPSNLLFDVLGFTSIAAYFYATYRYIRAYHRSVSENQANERQARLDWLAQGFIALIIVGLYDAGRIFMGYVFAAANSDIFYIITLMGAFMVMNWLILQSFRYHLMFDGLRTSEFLAVPPAKETAPLSAEEVKEAEAALRLLETSKLYLTPQLRLEQFSDASGIEPRRLSSLIRGHTGERFPQIVSRLRVAHAQKLIEEAAPEKCNFLRIAYDAGFNSKSAFNLAFKQVSGITPTEYRVRQREE
ncbi:helix-turn-helix transcriptional regulator [Kordiimonas lipolytica]|uniref:Helix-turn-helix transcriptional regulator n=1 Tax=Kordiimonas lipolytica TaxID=1662421 RepID=A0ABV8U7V4_9PROT|nr:AraC family transcriptional regulator [Kordiimonas lipolytica]